MTPPTIASEDGVIRVLQLSDPHLYGHNDGTLLGLNTWESFQAVLAHAQQQRWPPDLILASGDLVHDETIRGYQQLRRVLAPLGLPVYAIPGNHDNREIMAQALLGGTIQMPLSACHGAWQIILLDTSVPGKVGGHLDNDTLAQLEQCLKQPAGRHVLVCLHHHPIASGSNWLDTIGLDNGAALLELVGQYRQVRALVWGHIHQEMDELYNGIRLLGSPSTCIQFKPHSAEFHLDKLAPGYRWLHLHAHGDIDTGVARLAAIPGELDFNAKDY